MIRLAVVSFVAVLASKPQQYGQSLAAARSLAVQGKVDAAVVSIHQALSADPQNAAAQELLCKVQGSVDRFDQAIAACEAAHGLQPGNAAYTLELARAYGAKASHAGAFTGMRMVGRIRETFEAAVRQDPKNVDALSDLGEFYVNAPAMVGGGLDKARLLVAQLLPLSPARAARLEGMIASKEDDTAAADAAYARELAISHSAEAYVDLANYDRKRKLWDKAASSAVLAIERDNGSGTDTLDAAQILIDIHRDNEAAEKGLHSYLIHGQTSSVTSYAKAHVMLGQLLLENGDKAGATEQFNRALALASGYAPARKALHE